MNISEIKILLENGFEGCQVGVEGEGDHIHVTIVGTVFEGLSKVKRQQMVYSHLDEKIKNGEIHAVTMSTLTPAEQHAARN